MRKTAILTMALACSAFVAFTAPSMAQMNAAPNAPSSTTSGDAPQKMEKGAPGMSEGRATSQEKTGPVGETVPNGNVGGKEKSNANGG